MPYPNEHACRLRQPGEFDSFARKDCDQKHDGKCIDVIYGIKDGKSDIQALRYPKDIWTAGAASSHCESRGGIFEAAAGKALEVNHRAYSVLNLKSVDEEKRILEGIATTPAPDRMGDVVVPEGIEFSLPFPFLYQHNSSKPIGKVTDAKVNAGGMTVKVQIAKDTGVGFVEEAWALIKAGLVRGLSIGFRSLEESWDKQLNGFRFLRTEIMELSAVTIPANAEASITSVKSYARDAAALGNEHRGIVRPDAILNQPGVTGSNRNKDMKSLAEQLAALEAKHQANVARQTAIRAKALDEGRVMMDEAEGQEFDGLESENDSILKEITRLKKHQAQIATAVPVTEKSGSSAEGASRVRGGSTVQVTPPKLEPGIALSRYAIALAASYYQCGGKVDRVEAAEFARKQRTWKDSSPQVERLLNSPEAFRQIKEAVAAGTTSADGWASELADYTYMASEFIEYLRPMTIIGKIPGLRRVPANIKVPLQDGSGSVSWVGEGARKPVSAMHFDTATLRFNKAAGIRVVTEELVKHSSPSIEALVRDDLAGSMAEFLDEQFIQPAITVNGEISPASITNGATNTPASGTGADDLRADIKTALTPLIAANIDITGVVIVMQPSLALSISLMYNLVGVKEFPGMTASGGTLEGLACVTSNSVTSGNVVFLKPSEIFLVDDGGITIDISREASIEMDDGGSPTVIRPVSMWQTNQVAIRAEREITWKRRRTAAVYYITSAAYSATSP